MSTWWISRRRGATRRDAARSSDSRPRGSFGGVAHGVWAGRASVGVMRPVVATRRIAVISEQRLPTRALTGLTLVVLLLFGVAGLGHHKSDGLGEARVGAHAATSDIHAPAATAENAATFVTPTSGELAAAVCAIGLLCVLAGLLVGPNLLRGSRPATLMARHPRPAPGIAPRISIPPRALSRTLLGVSRT